MSCEESTCECGRSGGLLRATSVGRFPSTYVISVGRLVGSGPEQLHADAWARLRHAVRSSVESANAKVVFIGDGDGLFEGAPEPSVTVVAVGGLTSAALADLRLRLAGLAARFRQQSIALTIGTTEFVAPELVKGAAA